MIVLYYLFRDNMNRLNLAKRVLVVSAPVEGNSINSIVRMMA